jgi:hypothetical protein
LGSNPIPCLSWFHPDTSRFLGSESLFKSSISWVFLHLPVIQLWFHIFPWMSNPMDTHGSVLVDGVHRKHISKILAQSSPQPFSVGPSLTSFLLQCLQEEGK